MCSKCYYKQKNAEWYAKKVTDESFKELRKERSRTYKADPDFKQKRAIYDKKRREMQKTDPAMKNQRRNRDLKYKYGITLEDRHTMYINQNCKCKICNNVFDNEFDLYVDHCHESGKVRGLLCTLCNMGLGKFKDDIDRLKSAIKYIEDSKLA